MRTRLQKVTEIGSIGLLPAVLVACAYFGFRSSGALIFFAAILCLLLFFASWEWSKPALRQIMPVAVLSALAAAGRVIFAVAPSIQPVTAICIIAGSAFGRREGFMTGALAAFVSNCFLGQGMWTPWQMYAWGMVGYLSGLFFSRSYGHSASGADDVSEKTNPSGKTNIVLVCVFGIAASYLFSFIMNTWAIVGFFQSFDIASIVAIYAASFVLDTAHAVSTVVFILLLYPSWEKKLVRIKRKYALGT